MKKSLLTAYIVVILGIGAGIYLWASHDSAPQQKSKLAASKSTGSENTTFDKTLYSNIDPNSLWVIVNKKHPLPTGFKPTNLVVPNVPLRLTAQNEQMFVSSTMAPALEKLIAGAKSARIDLKLSSGYRSESLQKQFFDNYAARDGEQAAAAYSARPGTSEHQTGLAADLIASNDKCSLEICFANTPEGEWVAAHAHEHGFIIRYLKGKEDITTYQYEPWHFRYVGNELADQLYSNGQTMEEFFNY